MKKPTLALAALIAGLASFLLFGLQPLMAEAMAGWHPPPRVIGFFQWTYLVGTVLTALTAKLRPRADLSLMLLLYFPAAAYTLQVALPSGPQRLGDIAPMALWLGPVSTILLRVVARSAHAQESLRWYGIVAASNAGGILGVLVWLRPMAVDAGTVWLGIAVILFAIGSGLLALRRWVSPCSAAPQRGRIPPVSLWPRARSGAWLLLAMTASFAMMSVQRTLDVSKSHGVLEVGPQAALPLFAFLLAYVVAWAPTGHQRDAWQRRLTLHVLAGLFIAAAAVGGNALTAALLVVLYAVCACCVEGLRHCAPPPGASTAFQTWQALGGTCGGWIATAL